MRLKRFPTCEGRLCHDIYCANLNLLASIDIGNETFSHYGRMCLTEKAEMVLLTPPFSLLTAMLFLSFMSSYIWDDHKCKNHDLAKDTVYKIKVSHISHTC